MVIKAKRDGILAPVDDRAVRKALEKIKTALKRNCERLNVAMKASKEMTESIEASDAEIAVAVQELV